MEEWELRWQITSYYYYCYSTPTEMFSMHTAHLANVSKSVTKNATFPRTGGLPCLITHSCMYAASPTDVGGLIFCISAFPHPGSLFPLFHDFDLLPRECKYDILKKEKFSKEMLHMQEFCTCQSVCRGFDKYMVQ